MYKIEAATGGVLKKKKSVLKNFIKFTGKHMYTRPMVCNFFKKETLARVFSYEFCKIFKTIVFYRTPLVATSDG